MANAGITKAEAAVTWALAIANNPAHGYDQTRRWGPDYDCSSLVISAYEAAGVQLKSHGAGYTGNMYRVFRERGFADVTPTINLATGAGLQVGDVLLRHDTKTENGHTALFIGGGQIVHAASNERGGATGGTTGDQTGGEICTRGYYNSPRWDYVLRYVGEVVEQTPAPAPEPVTPQPAPVLVALPEISRGSTGPAVVMLQLILNYKLRNEAHFTPLELDGEAGALTDAAIRTVQAYNNLDADGICGQDTWRAILTTN